MMVVVVVVPKRKKTRHELKDLGSARDDEWRERAIKVRSLEKFSPGRERRYGATCARANAR